MRDISKLVEDANRTIFNLEARKYLLKDIDESELEEKEKDNLFELTTTLTDGAYYPGARIELKNNKRLGIVVDRDEDGKVKPRFVLITRVHPEGELSAEENMESISYKEAADLLSAEKNQEREEGR